MVKKGDSLSYLFFLAMDQNKSDWKGDLFIPDVVAHELTEQRNIKMDKETGKGPRGEHGKTLSVSFACDMKLMW